jgi:hypothetical protein
MQVEGVVAGQTQQVLALLAVQVVEAEGQIQVVVLARRELLEL